MNAKTTKPTKKSFDPSPLLMIDTWIRLAYMVFFGAIAYLVCAGIILIAAFQFIVFLFTGKKNSNLLDLSESLCDYIKQIFTYLTFIHDNKPFPFASWGKK